jgi:hypothetical protein
MKRDDITVTATQSIAVTSSICMDGITVYRTAYFDQEQKQGLYFSSSTLISERGGHLVWTVVAL